MAGVRDTTLGDSLSVTRDTGTPVSSTNKTYHHDITEILLKVALNTISLNRIKLNRGIFPKR